MISIETIGSEAGAEKTKKGVVVFRIRFFVRYLLLYIDGRVWEAIKFSNDSYFKYDAIKHIAENK